MRFLQSLTLVLFVLGNQSLLRAEKSDVQVVRIDGSQIEGNIVEWNSEGVSIQPKDASEEISIGKQDLLRIQVLKASPAKSVDQNLIVLTDGSQFSFSSLTIASRQASVTTAVTEKVLSIPVAMIHYIQYSRDDETKRTVLNSIATQANAGDTLVIQKKKTGALDYLTGVIGDVSEQKVEFNWDGELIPVKLSKIAALAFYQSEGNSLVEPVCWLAAGNDSRFAVKEVQLSNGTLEMSTVAGLKINVPVAEMVSVDYSVGKIVYLSDLKPIFQKWYPQIGLPQSAGTIASYGLPRNDQAFSGSSLSLLNAEGSEQAYAKGIALRSRTEMTYRIPKGMKRFLCVAGIDPLTRAEGNVTLTLSTKNKTLWHGEIDGQSDPLPINVQLDGEKKLKILVDYGANLDYGDRLHLVEARFSK